MHQLNATVVSRLRQRASRDVENGQIPGCAYAVAKDGELVLSEAFGVATTDSRFVVMSASKTIFDSAVWLLLGSGALNLDDHVAKHIPEFGTNGKDAVTVAQLMTHTGGFPRAPLDWPEWRDRSARLQAFREWELESTPGEQFEYHASSHSWVEAELVERLSGLPYADFLTKSVLEPLGLSDVISLGAPVEQQRDVLSPVLVMPDEAVQMLPPFFRDSDGNLAAPAGLGTPEGRAAGFPGAGVVATAAGVATLYQAFLHNPDELWRADVLADAVGTIRNDLPDDEHGDAGSHDPVPHPPVAVLRTISMVVAGPAATRYGSRHFFGEHVSDAAFGHLGLGGNLVWADPASGLSFCYLTNGVAFLPGLPHDGALNRDAELSNLAGRLLSG